MTDTSTSPDQSPSLSNTSDKFFLWSQGRTTAFALGYFVLGNILYFMGKLQPLYITFMLSHMGLVLGHSLKEDYFSQGK